jgi:hypothetical protein
MSPTIISPKELVVVVRNYPHMYTMYKQKDGSVHVLEVVCGGAAMYEQAIVLNEEEVARAVESPESLRDVAYDLCHTPERFAGREVIIKS